jgi:hypothetical protein
MAAPQRLSFGAHAPCVAPEAAHLTARRGIGRCCIILSGTQQVVCWWVPERMQLLLVAGLLTCTAVGRLRCAGCALQRRGWLRCQLPALRASARHGSQLYMSRRGLPCCSPSAAPGQCWLHWFERCKRVPPNFDAAGM